MNYLNISLTLPPLCKLQVVRHFWERNDIKGAITAIRKLPDHAVGIYWIILCVVLIPLVLRSGVLSAYWFSNNDVIMVQVQADVISVLLDKLDILTLDLFSCLLPVLLGLLDSKIER